MDGAVGSRKLKRKLQSERQTTAMEALCKKVGSHLSAEEVMLAISDNPKRSRNSQGCALENFFKTRDQSTQTPTHTTGLYRSNNQNSQTRTTSASTHPDALSKQSRYTSVPVKFRSKNPSGNSSCSFTSPGREDHHNGNFDSRHIDISRSSRVDNPSHRTVLRRGTTEASNKNGSVPLISLSATHDSTARLTLENYREQIQDLIRKLRKFDLYPHLYENFHKKVQVDPVEDYFSHNNSCISQNVVNEDSIRIESEKKKCLRSYTQRQVVPPVTPTTSCTKKPCEVKMRVKIQYKSHAHVLGQIRSLKHGNEERQFDRYHQAINALRSRETGCVVCDISFTDVTYLGAFWRDYTNGALQEALKAIFLTEMMRESAGDEELDVFVSVDEHDFRKGQLQLLKQLQDQRAASNNWGVARTARVEL